MVISNACLSYFNFRLPSELLLKRYEKYLVKMVCHSRCCRIRSVGLSEQALRLPCTWADKPTDRQTDRICSCRFSRLCSVLHRVMSKRQRATVNFRRQTARRNDWALYYKDLGNAKHGPKAWGCRLKRVHNWRKRDHCGWTARPSKPGSPETNVFFNTPYT